MARMIDAESLNWGRCPFNAVSVSRWLDEAPTIDAVPVVRCRGCKYNNSPDCPMVYEEYFFDEDDGGDTYVIDKAVDPEGFCSYGERREGDGDA